MRLKPLLLLILALSGPQLISGDKLDRVGMKLRMASLRSALASQSDSLAIAFDGPPQASAPLYEKYELSFKVDAPYSNPYDPDDIRVDGAITLPDGRVLKTPAFYFEPWTPSNGLTQMVLSLPFKKAGESCWKLRFSPSMPGKHVVKIEASLKDGRKLESQAAEFVAEPSSNNGFIRVSKSNPRYFETSADGKLWWGTGSNVPWIRAQDPGNPLPCYEYYFAKGDGKMNATRVWLCHWAWLEWTPMSKEKGTNWSGYGGAGYYNQMIAETLDRVFRLAESHGLRVMLVTEDNDEVDGGERIDGWASNPYNVLNGGPCAFSSELATNEEAVRLYKNRLRYVMARWGYSTSLWSIDSWNDCSSPTPEFLAWHKTMRDYVHSLCESWRPVIYGSNYSYEANEISDYAQPHAQYPKNKPAVVQECYYSVDKFKEGLHEELWKGLAGGMAAIMVWPHDLVDKTGSWDEFKAPMAFANAMRLNAEKTRPAQIKALSAKAGTQGAKLERVVSLSPYGDVPAWGVKAPKSRFEIDFSNANQWLEGFSSKLYGNRQDRREWKAPPTFAIDMPSQGRALIEVGEIGNGTQILTAKLDGAKAASFELKGGRKDFNGRERWFEVPLTQGKHEFLIDCEGGNSDWIFVNRVCFVYEAADPAGLILAKGVSSGDEGFAYLMNMSASGISQNVLGRKPETLSDCALEIAAGKGSYEISLHDTSTGDAIGKPQTVEAEGGAIKLSVPKLESDMAIRWIKKH